jgi:putative transposase
MSRVRYGYCKIHVLLQRESDPVSRKVVYRLCRGQGLPLRYKPNHTRRTQTNQAASEATATNDTWGLDFIVDPLRSTQRVRALTSRYPPKA